jgi:hypothetical protein
VFDLGSARTRLEAVDVARSHLEKAAEALLGAKVKNVRVNKAMAMCRKELTDFHHVVEYSIRKRENRIADHQPTRSQGPKVPECEEQVPCT